MKAMDASTLAALAEPNRLRIVELLADAPRTVGEIAALLDLRQPQVTKHVQTLHRAEIVEVHPLGRRRVCALRRHTLDELARWAGRLAVPGADDAALARYDAAVADVADTPVTVRRRIPASRSAVWRAFIEPALAGRWWHPRHFAVAAFHLEPRPGGAIGLSLREGDGTAHHAQGRGIDVDGPRRLAFTLDPLDADGRALFTARHEVRLSTGHGHTDVELTVTPDDMRPGAETAVAGLAIGWEQLLDNLAALADDGGLDPPRRR